MRDIEALVLANIQSPNVGNGALVTGTLNSISEGKPELKILPKLYSWDQITFKESIFPEDFFTRTNESQLLLIPGAVTFNGRFDHQRGGSRLNFNVADIEKIKVPIIAQGLSYRFWNENVYPNLNELSETFSYLNSKRNCLIGLRNDGSKEWLEETVGKQLDNMPECPDPGFFVGTPRFGEIGKDLFISVNYEDSLNRYKDQLHLENTLNALVNCCEIFTANTNEKVVFVPHSFEDYEMIILICKRLKPGTLHKRIRVLSIPGFENHMSIYDSYRTARAVIAMRIHSLSPAVGMRIPTFVISTQKRMTTYMKKIKLGNQITEINDESLWNKCEKFLEAIIIEKFNFVDQDLAISQQKNQVMEFYAKAQFI